MAKKSRAKQMQARMAAENRDAEKRRVKERVKARKEAGEAIYEKAVSREEKSVTEKVLDLIVRDNPHDSNHPVFPVPMSTFRSRAETLVAYLDESRTRFLTTEYASSLMFLLGAGDWARPLEDWKPKGRGRGTQFRSLVEHLLCEYPVPHFLFRVFRPVPQQYGIDHTEARKRREWLAFFAGVGRGMSAAKLAKAHIKMPMTKKMVHRFMQTTGNMDFDEALRWVQVTEFTDDIPWAKRLHGALMTANQFRATNNLSAEDEVFWQDVVRLFARQTMLDPNEVNPLIDYIRHMKNENPDWGMKGRTLTSLTKGMEEWHNILHKIKKVQGHTFESAGFKRGSWRVLQEGRKDLWWHYAVEEILSTKKLADEGRSMKHCVYSYGRSIEAGRVSIWSLRRWPSHKEEVFDEATEKMKTVWVEHGDWDTPEDRILTIEVTNREKAIVQVRGKMNRAAKTHEKKWVEKWAAENGLSYRASMWGRWM